MQERGREGPKHYTQNDYKGLGQGDLWGPSLRPSVCSMAHCDVHQSIREVLVPSFPASPIPSGTVLCLSHFSSPSTMLMVPNIRINWSANRFGLCFLSLIIFSVSSGSSSKVLSPRWKGSHLLTQ